MTYTEFYSIIQNSKNNKFKVTFKNGETKTLRLFVTSNYICEFNYKSTKKGYIANTDEWKTIKEIEETPNHILVRRFLQRVVYYLEKSGLWHDIKESYKKILLLDDTELIHILSLNWDEQRKYLKENVHASFFVDCIIKTAKKGIVNINYSKYEKEYMRNKFKEIIKNENEHYRYTWREKYDNSIEFVEQNNIKKAWYSEEYKNMGNGHYYFAIDEKHAIFAEDD